MYTGSSLNSEAEDIMDDVQVVQAQPQPLPRGQLALVDEAGLMREFEKQTQQLKVTVQEEFDKRLPLTKGTPPSTKELPKQVCLASILYTPLAELFSCLVARSNDTDTTHNRELPSPGQYGHDPSPRAATRTNRTLSSTRSLRETTSISRRPWPTKKCMRSSSVSTLH